MLLTIAVILLVLWAVGGIALPAVGGLINILLVLAVIIIVIKLARGEKI